MTWRCVSCLCSCECLIAMPLSCCFTRTRQGSMLLAPLFQPQSPPIFACFSDLCSTMISIDRLPLLALRDWRYPWVLRAPKSARVRHPICSISWQKSSTLFAKCLLINPCPLTLLLDFFYSYRGVHRRGLFIRIVFQEQ
ncbi:hypothetical protein EDD21DRAFT_55826 [Dissophora ornata]|nr:hypothetical protein EDD21DRAFT_55826 [Dissophora ornata]